MRHQTDIRQLATVRKSSTLRPQTLVLEHKSSREFFRYAGGSLVEYDCTKYLGRLIKLTDEEISTL